MTPEEQAIFDQVQPGDKVKYVHTYLKQKSSAERSTIEGQYLAKESGSVFYLAFTEAQINKQYHVLTYKKDGLFVSSLHSSFISELSIQRPVSVDQIKVGDQVSLDHSFFDDPIKGTVSFITNELIELKLNSSQSWGYQKPNDDNYYGNFTLSNIRGADLIISALNEKPIIAEKKKDKKAIKPSHNDVPFILSVIGIGTTIRTLSGSSIEPTTNNNKQKKASKL